MEDGGAVGRAPWRRESRMCGWPWWGQWAGTPLLGWQVRLVIVNRLSRGKEIPLSHVLTVTGRSGRLGIENCYGASGDLTPPLYTIWVPFSMGSSLIRKILSPDQLNFY